MAKRPYDATQMPDLRETLRAKWASEPWFRASVLAHTLQPHSADDSVYPKQGLVYPAPADVRTESAERQAIRACATERGLLEEAALYWVNADMCDLLYAAVDGVPDDTMVADLDIPSSSGLVMLEKPWTAALDCEQVGKYIQVDAFAWGKTKLAPVPEVPQLGIEGGVGCLSFSGYTFIDFGQGCTDGLLQLAVVYDVLRSADRKLVGRGERNGEGGPAFVLTGGDWVPIGRSDWPMHLPANEPLECNPAAFRETGDMDAFMQSTLQDRRIMSAFFALLNPPGFSSVRESKPSRQVVRQAERKGRPVPSPVKIVYLRRPAKPREQGDGEAEGRHLTYRHAVRPHLVNQPYGPGRKYRRLQMRSGSIRGPEGAPFIAKETVHAWVR